MQTNNEYLDRIEDEFKRGVKQVPPVNVPEHIAKVLLTCGFVKDLRGFNLNKKDEQNGNN